MFDKDNSGFITEEEVPGILIETYKELGQKFVPTKSDVRSWVIHV
jgi:Ca2+-binding EF-hand superfamily protein